MSGRARDYSTIESGFASTIDPGFAARRAHGSADVLRTLTNALWDALSPTGVSWLGFYLGPGQTMPDGRVVAPDEMLLGHCRPKPACSPIGLHGVCGRGWRERACIVVRDVRSLGADYVACDPRDMSEVVVPLIDAGGHCTGVLDLDSHDIGAFNERDARELMNVLKCAGLTHAGARATVVHI